MKDSSALKLTAAAGSGVVRVLVGIENSLVCEDPVEGRRRKKSRKNVPRRC